jgi:hypothetical protein
MTAVLFGHKGVGLAFGPRAACTSDPMDIIFNCLWEIIVDN